MKLRAEFTLTENMDQPKWLAHLAPHAKIYIVWANIFNSLRGPNHSSLGYCVKMATGGRAVSSVLVLPHGRLQSTSLSLDQLHAPVS